MRGNSGNRCRAASQHGSGYYEKVVHALARGVHRDGNSSNAASAIVTGYTSSPNFPVSAGALQTQFGGNNGINNAFVTKLDPSGIILFSTFLGGIGPDSGSAIQTDSTGNIFVAGTTGSSNFPTTPGTSNRLPWCRFGVPRTVHLTAHRTPPVPVRWLRFGALATGLSVPRAPPGP